MRKKQPEKPNNKANPPPAIFLIPENHNTTDSEFDSLNNPVAKQQQQVMIIGSDENKIIDLDYGNSSNGDKIHLQKQFQEIRFGQCNLMDMDIQEQRQGSKTVMELSQYEYERFLEGRQIVIDLPQLINEGYLTSYKLYEIKTRVANNKQTISHNQMTSQRKTSQANNQFDTCVSRRFSDFQYLNQVLMSSYGGFIIPLLPQKNFWATVNLQGKEYTENRTKSLSNYLNRLFQHKKLRLSAELRHFLFEDDQKFSARKGEYAQKTKFLEEKVKALGIGALEYGKSLYQRFMMGSGSNKSDEEIRLSKSKLTKEDLQLGEYEIIVMELMRIMGDLKRIVENTIQENSTVNSLMEIFGNDLSQPMNDRLKDKDGSEQLIGLQEEFQEISQFVNSCAAAIQRRQQVKQEIQALKQQQVLLQEKYKNSPRSLQLDLVRSKLQKLNKANQTYAEELIKELQIHVDQGKGMLKKFVDKFEKVRTDFFERNFMKI